MLNECSPVGSMHHPQSLQFEPRLCPFSEQNVKYVEMLKSAIITINPLTQQSHVVYMCVCDHNNLSKPTHVWCTNKSI